MNRNLARLISDYQERVRRAIELLVRSGIPMPETSFAWVANGIPNRGRLVGGADYFKHGYGCEVSLPGRSVDFDFGDLGETDGFDVWRLANFAGSELANYGFASKAELEACFKAEEAAGSLVRPGYGLWYLHSNAA